MKKTLSFVLIFVFVASFSIISIGATGGSFVGVYINGSEFSGRVQVKDATTFVGVRRFANEVDPSASVKYSYQTRTLTISSSKLYMTLTDGASYAVANGRYLYTESPIFMKSGIMYAPVTMLAKAFDAKISWQNSTSSFYITRGSGGILSGDRFYREDEVYWLSRIINAESGGEILKGKIAVGNVILNRTRSSSFPNTIYGVIFDRKYGTQFSPVANGTIYKSPNSQSVIAAKICLEGYSINTGILYFVNPRVSPNNWIISNRRFFAQIGNHAFYY
ncbi:MAG: cell wall hydrolase [Clostridia bacterium]|nr:cell wall hydrolase [Clostridia bacterium]